MRIAWIALLIVFVNTLVAQTPAYLHYGVQDGLPSNLVYCGLQDRRGLLWFGTDKGLACFDGMRFRVYGVADGLPDPEVLNMKEDSQGRLWLFCFRKKPCYMLDGRIVTEKEDAMLAGLELETGQIALSELYESGVWITGGNNRAYWLVEDQFRAINFPVPISGFHKIDSVIFILGLGNIMRFTSNGDIEFLKKIESRMAKSYPSQAVSKNHFLYCYQGQTLLFAWEHGKMRKLDDMTNPTGQAYTDQLGRFWICSPKEGAVLFNNNQGDLSNPKIYLPDKKTIRVFEDSQNNLWFCTVDEGIYMLQQNTPLNYRNDPRFPSNNIRCITRDQSGNVFAGDDIGNIHILGNNGAYSYLSTGSMDGYNLVRQITPLGVGQFYAATDENLFYADKNYSRIKDLDLSTSLKSIVIIGDTIWIGASWALAYKPSRTSKYRRVFIKRITSLIADNKTNIWAGSIDGLYSQRDSFQTNWGDIFPQLKSRIVAIATASKNKLWVVTPESGLLSVAIQAGKVTGVEAVNDKLVEPINNIQSLYIAENGTVWMATNRGVFGMDKQMQTVHYSVNDGLADDDVNAVLVHNDTLWAGTAAGLSCINLKADNEYANFQTLLVNLRYQRKNEQLEFHLLDSFNTQRRIILPANTANLELDLTGLDYRSRGNMHFEIIRTNTLLPFQFWTPQNVVQWLTSGFSDNQVTILEYSGTYTIGSYIPPGNYTYVVTAKKASGIRSALPDHWTLLKKPYWYETIWFYLAIFACIAYGIWRIYRARIAYQELRTNAANLQLQALQAQMNPHFIGNTVNAIQQFMHPPNPEKTSEYIALFVRLLRRTMHYSEDTFITFKDEIAYCAEYLRLVQLRFEDHFHFEIIGAEQVPSDLPVPSMLLQPILENATIHGIATEGDSFIQIEINIDKDLVCFVITDNGIGLIGAKKQKQKNGGKRKSIGGSILNKKIFTLNRLHDLDLKLNVQDLSELQPAGTGTRATIQYSISKIWKASAKNTKKANRTP